MVVGVPVLPAVEKLRQELQKALLLGAVQGLHELLALPAALLLAQAALIAALLGGTDKELAAVAGLPLPGDEALVLQLLDDLATVARKRNNPFCMNVLRNTQQNIVGCFFVINFVIKVKPYD